MVYDVVPVLPTFATPPGMFIQTHANSSSCQLSCSFQSAHLAKVNVLLGDGHVSSLPGDFDPVSLNYYCVGAGREVWSGSGPYVPVP